MADETISILELTPATFEQVKSNGYIPVSVTGNTYRLAISEISDTSLGNRVSTIEGKIPNSATSTNQLVDKSYVDNQLNQVAARYLSRDVSGNPFASYEQFTSAQSSGGFFYAGVSTTPTKNDYVLVSSDATHSNAVTRYWYTGSSWSFQYVVNNTPFTDAEWAAIHSGVTSAKVTQYDGYAAGKADKRYVDDMLGNVEDLLASL